MRDKLYSLLALLYIVALVEVVIFVPLALIYRPMVPILLLWTVVLVLVRYGMTRRSEGVAELPPDDLEIKICPWRYRGRNVLDYLDLDDLIDDQA